MSNDAEPRTSEKPDATVNIWGSCVSRDTLEFMPHVELGAYVARQSAIVALAPVTGLHVPAGTLESEFQRRMLAGDMASDAKERVSQIGAAYVLVDLVDERHGVWKFPNCTFLTNSVEAYKAGVEEWAPDMGARLIPFGTDEHFDLWTRGFELIAQQVTNAGKPILLLDIAWAEVFEGQVAPRGLVSFLSRMGRRGQRGVNGMVDAVRRDRTLLAGLEGFRAAPLSFGDEHLRIAREANAKYRRYIAFAQKYAAVTISRSSEEVRMNKAHKWGIGPYHYSDCDYRKIGEDLDRILRSK